GASARWPACWRRARAGTPASAVAGSGSAVSSAARWSASRSSSAGSVGAAATKTVAWGGVGGPGPVVEPVETVVGDAAAGLAVVFVVDEPAAVVDGLGAAAVVVVASGAVVTVDAVVGADSEAAFPAPPPQAEAVSV